MQDIRKTILSIAYWLFLKQGKADYLKMGED